MLAVLALALASYWSLRLTWADHLSNAMELSGRERAVQLVPASAEFAERLAVRREQSGGDPLPEARRAVALDAENPDRLMRLGVRAEMAGDYPLAERSLLAAAARSRLYQPKYLLAQYYFRRGDSGHFWPWARAALETVYDAPAPLFELCGRMRPDGVWLGDRVLPASRPMLRQFLAWLSDSKQWVAAAEVARRLLRDAQDADRAVLLQYCEARLTQGDAREAVEIWNTLCARRVLPDVGLDSLVTNGDFQHPPSGLGFDWRLVPQAGVTSAVTLGTLRIDFSGRQPERCPLAWQYLPTVPGTRYRLRYEARGSGGEPAPGVTWEVSDADVHPDADGTLRFTASRELTRLILIYQRPPGSSRLGDTVSIGRVGLERAP